MSLFVRGNRKKIKQLREQVERGGLEVVLYSEDFIGVEQIELAQKKSESKYTSLTPFEARIASYLEQKKAEGSDYVPMKDLLVLGDKTMISTRIKNLVRKRVVSKDPNPNYRRGGKTGRGEIDSKYLIRSSP